jgi:hypothetical protein
VPDRRAGWLEADALPWAADLPDPSGGPVWDDPVGSAFMMLTGGIEAEDGR